MIIPVGPDGKNQKLLQVDRSTSSVSLDDSQVDREGEAGVFEQDFVIQSLMGVRYVPLVK
jgi:hypothetical protein